VHFSNFFRYMEATEHEFFRSLGFPVHHHGPEGMRGWVRVHASCDYVAPLRYEDRVEIHLRVEEKTKNSFTYAFTFRKLPEPGDASAPEVAARGRLRVVCVTRRPGDARLRASRMPEDIAARIEVAPPGDS
jgi:YbgC/YbaW family acyl-CoA thioester hydrolase